MKSRKIIFLLILCLILSSLPACADAADHPALTKDVKILFTSDVHCAIDKGWGYGGVYAVKQGLSQNHYVILADNGDAIQGEPVGLLTKGKGIIEIMNAVGYDVAIPGNHEFDYGLDNFLELAEAAEYPYISCNFNKEGELVFQPYVIKEFDGVQIAFVGVTTPYTIRDSAPKYFMDDNGTYIYGFFQDKSGEGVYQAVQRAVDSAREDGADYVVVLAHMGNENEVTPWKYSDVISNTTGIDAWLDGHSHDTDQVVMKDKSGHLVCRSACGTKNAFIGVLTIAGDGTISTELLPWSSSISAPDLLALSNPATEAVAEVTDAISKGMEYVIAHAAADLVIYDPVAKMSNGKPVRIIQNAETNLGDLCADAYLNQFAEADIALVNGNGIRANFSKGDISFNDVLTVLPYGTKLDLIEVTGRQVLDALEWSVHSVPEEFGGFEHVAGLTYEIDPSIPSPCVEDDEGLFIRIDELKPRRIRNVRIGTDEADPERVYKLVTNDYILMDGDGFTMFRDAVVLENGKEDCQALAEYIIGPLDGIIGEEYANPYGQGRMVSIDAKD